MTGKRDDQTSIEVEGGDAVPDADDAPEAEDLLPEEPADDAPAAGDPHKKSAAAPPVPAHGESASAEQIREAAEAAEIADG